MADFDFSMAITADGDQAAGEVNRVKASVEGLAGAEKQAAGAASSLDAATGGAAQSAGRLAAESGRAAASSNNLSESERRVAAAAAQASAALDKASASVARQRAGYTQLGFQIQDITSTLALGISPLTVLGQQAGQTGQALALMGGTAGRVGAFFAGPWGSILVAATVILSPLVSKLFEGSTAADELAKSTDAASKAADSFGAAQSLLGQIIDLTTGKLKTQNQVLIQTIRLQASANVLKAQADQQSARDTIKGAGTPSFFSRFLAGFADAGNQNGEGDTTLRNEQADAPLRRVTAGILAGNTDVKSIIAQVDQLAAAGKLAGRSAADIITLKEQLLTLPRAINDQKAAQQVLDAIDGKGIASDLVPFSRGKKAPKAKAPKKGPDPFTVAEFGRDTSDRITSILEAFRDTPSQIAAVNRGLRQLDDLIDDLRKKKPPGFDKLIADAKRAKDVVREGLNKPFQDFLDTQRQVLENQRLLVAGHDDQAEALKIVVGLEKQQDPLSQAQKDQVLLTVQALKEEQRELDILREKQQTYLGALGEVKGAVTGVFTDGVKGLTDLPKRLLNTFINLQANVLTEKLFGSAFRDLQDRITGQDIVKDSAQKFADTIEAAKAPVDNLTNAAQAAADALNGIASGGIGSPSLLPTDPKEEAAKKLVDEITSGSDGGLFSTIVVNGKKQADLAAASTNENTEKSITSSPRQFFNETLGKLGTSIFGEKIGQKIGEFGGKAFAGAATGTLVNSVVAPLGKALGFKTSKTGAQIGGAIGSFIQIPGGEIIGSVIGSVVGGLFKKTKTGSATIGNVNGEVGQTGTGGNNAGQQKIAAQLGGAVGDSISQIADALGGQIGNFAVSIGKKDKKFTVDPTGKGRTKGSGVQKFSTEEEAQVAALTAAISQGAIAGVSAAVQRALQSSTDTNKAVKEALKVEEVETLLGGIGYDLQKQFRTFEQQARERVRIAQQYGFDVVKIEKINAEQRVKLVDDLLTSRIGALQQLLTDFASGDLFEGDAKTKRAAILAQIATTRTQVDAGVAGAGDTLAGLLRNLSTSSRDAFGTAGPEFASDRQTAIDNATAVIAAERARIEAAQAAVDQTNSSLATANTLTDETNGLLAITNSKLDSVIAGLFGGSTSGFYYTALTARAANL